jgi:hypothetical protein
MEMLNMGLVVLAIVATVYCVRKFRGSKLALWFLVIWFIPIIGPVLALTRSAEKYG